MSTAPPPALRSIPNIPEMPLVGSLRPFASDRLSFFMRMSRECPDIGAFHIGPARMYFVSSPTMVSAIFAGSGDLFAPVDMIRHLVPLFGLNSLLVLYGPPHMEQRRLMAPVFQPRRVSGLDVGMTELARDSVDEWREGASLCVPQEMMHLTLRIVGRTLFGVDFKHEASDLSQAVTLCMKHAEHLSSSPIHLPLSWPTPRNRRVRKSLELLSRRMKEMIAERRRSGQEGGDLLSMMLAHRDENGQGMTEEQLRDQCVTIFAAGQETTAALLGSVWGMLLRHPEAYQKLQDEVDTVLEGRVPTAEDVKRMPYMQQVLKEMLRMYPPSFMQGRTVLQDMVLEGYPLKKGDSVLISPYTIHRNEAYYPDPERFQPERFSTEEEKKRPRHAFIPFGSGPKVCIGNHFAMLMANMLMSVMMQRVRFEMIPGERIAPTSTFTLQMGDFNVRVRRRPAPETLGAPRATAV